MITTLNKILEHKPCSQNSDEGGWGLLLKSLNKTHADDEPLDLMHILKSNGIKDAVWALRCFDYLDYCLFLADVAESVLEIYDSKYDNPTPRRAIKAIRQYKAGEITLEELKVFADAAESAEAAAYAAEAAEAATYAAEASAEATAAEATAYAAADASAWAADAAADAADYARRNKWNEIEALFIKHFGEQK